MTDGKIFISYRRADSSGFAGRLFDRLGARFGDKQVFMDVEHLDPGVNFVEALNQAVSECDVLVALIGPQWLGVRDEKGQRRLDNPLDFVRLEIAAALARQIRVIPILLQGAVPPQQGQLPDDLQPLAQLNALEIRHERFNADADRLVRAIETYRQADAAQREREAVEKAARAQAEREQRSRELAEQETRIANCLEKAQAALEREDWETAQSNYREILRLRPTHTAAQAGLQTASSKLELSRLYGQAILYQDEGRFAAALRNLRRIQGKAPNYQNVPDLIKALEALLAEEVPREQPTKDDRPSLQPRIMRALSALPRSLWYLGGSVGLILMIVLACWGGNALLASLRGTETPQPTATTPVAQAPTLTDSPRLTTKTPTDTPTLHPAVDTNTPSPSGTATPEPTFTPSSTEGPPTLITDDYGVPLALVPAGAFQMGSEDGDDDEKPVHTVTLDDFYIDQYEVTNAHYAECVDAGVCDSPSNTASYTRDSYYGNTEYADYPVIYVDWNAAQTYCQWRGARLPTEAEWEKAARGGLEGALYPWGDDVPVCETGTINGAKFDDNDVCNDTNTEPVGSYGPNGYELYDMAGNVWEWVADWYDGEYYANSPENNPTGPEDGGARVLRGGGWADLGYYLRAANRSYAEPSHSLFDIGFRCARSP